MRIWLDDTRPMPAGYTHWARTADEAIALLKTGEATEISLDHDLGHGEGDGYAEEKTGYTVAKFIEEAAHKGQLKPLRCRVHSQNSVGRENIKQALRSAHKAWNTQ